MTIDLNKYITKDIKSILFEHQDDQVLKPCDGYKMDLDKLSQEERRYLVSVVFEAYIKGATRCVDVFNKGEERKARQAQDRAIKKILNGKY